ncbi:molybdenum cofactor guanylyltransferase [Bacillus sp. REN16]|uniref:molybdenum cofactor guanylyltransferase n=1 Tax=Bacillus sp. REN16 TaxID=2887296 RepID=UPI001E3D9FE5|nr:molybdenum cofactor guanylyltransferase [Bacillus sp. REN16]MCC3355573.1 molybdenum cofactor guanylyltransferase [Bacillus sp. REN16]
MNKAKITGILLAGGESRRFGSHKAFAKLHHKYFYEYAIEALEGNVDELLIVSHPALEGQFRNQTTVEVLLDVPEYKGNGPLAGIFTAMQKQSSDWYVILPCDTPLVSDELVKQLITFTKEEGIDAVVPIINNRQQPLIAVYHSRVVKKIEQLLNEKNLKMSLLLDRCNVKFVKNHDLRRHESEFENINNQTEYEKIQQKPMTDISNQD